MQELTFKRTRDKVRNVKRLILSAGNKIGSIHFIKRSDGSRRRISYRLHVRKPTYAKAPSGNNSDRRLRDEKNNLITLFDCNSVRYDKKGRINGRGNWKSIPINNVYRIKVNGSIYRIK